MKKRISKTTPVSKARLDLDSKDFQEDFPRASTQAGARSGEEQHEIVQAFRQMSQPEAPQMTMKAVIQQGERMSISQMFNVLLGVLCDLTPSFFYTRHTTLGDLVDAIVEVRAEWFENIATPGEFWGVLRERGLPTRDYFTIESRLEWESRQKNSALALSGLLNFASDEITRRSQFAFETGQEIDTLQRSASDGRSGKNWRSDENRRARIYEREAASFRVELLCASDQTATAETAPLDLPALEKLTQWQDADFCYCLLYVLRLIVPEHVLPADLAKIQWIDLDDVMEKIGWYPAKLSREEREEQRARIYRYLVYGNQASLVGRRAGTYRDRATGEPISTQISSPLWRIMDVERPVQPELMEADGASQTPIPRKVRLALSKEWEPVLISSELHQYLPMAEVIAAIPPNKVAGDWARSMALVLARLWRMNPREALASGVWITRRELLTSYSSKTPADELLQSNDPKRAVRYWHNALSLLVECLFVADADEAARTVEEMLQSHSKYGWQEAWLDERVLLRPGGPVGDSINGRAQALPPSKPKILGSSAPLKKRKKRSDPNTSGE